MFVDRCFFYIENNRIVSQYFEIEWMEELTYAFRNTVVYAIESNVPKKHLPATDVTSSSQYRDIRDMNVFSVKYPKTNLNFYQYWNTVIKNIYEEADEIPGLFSYLYLNCLSADDIDATLKYNCFYDIYYNPKKKYNSVALTLIALKLLIKQNKLDYLRDMNKFMYWYYCNVDTMLIKR
ncbi:MAG: hypothetical protein IJE43_19685 [Alphaproteobacteria bacterium]|nr:hypothetical protein [Alphaproteobacteria bacterium]